MSGSSGSGVANPLSPPPTVTHSEREIGPPMPPKPPVRLLLGPRNEGPSCRLPSTLYGIALSTVTWYIWPMGSSVACHDMPRFIETDTFWSLPTIMRSPSSGSIHMSWKSPPGRCRP